MSYGVATVRTIESNEWDCFAMIEMDTKFATGLTGENVVQITVKQDFKSYGLNSILHAYGGCTIRKFSIETVNAFKKLGSFYCLQYNKNQKFRFFQKWLIFSMSTLITPGFWKYFLTGHLYCYRCFTPLLTGQFLIMRKMHAPTVSRQYYVRRRTRSFG